MSRLTRAQTLTKEKRTEYFSDFTTAFSVTPVGDQLARNTNEKAVYQALKNLIQTKPGERLFNPNFGCYLANMLFEHNLDDNLALAEKYVRDAITSFEPRVQIISLNVTNDDARPHHVYVNLNFRIINNEEPQTITILLRRVR